MFVADTLLTPVMVGDHLLRNRVVMPPLTRNRATTDFVPTPRMALYYAQRASAGLQVSEATSISGQAVPYPRVPGIWTREQVQAWSDVTGAVHSAGGLIFMQLWHCGRVSHSATQPGGEIPVAPSAIAVEGELYTARGMQPFEVPRALLRNEIPGIVNDYQRAAVNAKVAGFDGVEIHSANGYLLDQFLNDRTNLRTDDYGGGRAGRMRLVLEVVDSVSEVWGPSRVGVRLSPSGTFMDCRDSDKLGLYSEVITALASRDLAYLHLVEPTIAGSMTVEASPDDIPTTTFRPLYPGTLIVSGDHTLDSGDRAVKDGTADLVGFGRLFISNPDLPYRFEAGAELQPSDRRTYYSDTDEGYLDYPTLRDERTWRAVRAGLETGTLDRSQVLDALSARSARDLVASDQLYTFLRLRADAANSEG